MKSAPKKSAPNPKQEVSKQYHHGNLREVLINEGIKLLEETGKTDISLRELSRRIGVSANAAYRHFATKNDLIEALAIEGYQRMKANLNARAKTEQAEYAMINMGMDCFNFAKENPALHQLMCDVSASENKTEAFTQVSDAFFDTLREKVAMFWYPDVENANESEEVLVSSVFAWSLVHGLTQHFLHGQLSQFSDDPAALIKQVLITHSPKN